MSGVPVARQPRSPGWVAASARRATLMWLPLAAAAAGATLLGEAGLARTLTVFFITLALVLGFQVFIGNSGVMSFGHVAFMGLAAYVSSLLTMAPADKTTLLPNLPGWLAQVQLDFWVAAPLTLVVVAVVAFLIGIPFSRLSGSAASIATLGLLVITNVVLVGAQDFTNGASSFFGVPAVTTIWHSLGWVAVVLLIASLFRDSTTGLQLRASREDEAAAAAGGVDVPRVRLMAWVVSAVCVGGAGILLAHYLTAFSPRQFYLVETFNVIAILIVGGSASVSGAVVGAVIMTVAFELLRRAEEALSVFGLTGVFVSLLILVMMVRRPEGLAGYTEAEVWIRPLLQRLRSRSPRDG